MSPTALTSANALEDAPGSKHFYAVTAGDQTYTIEAIDAYVAERKARAMFHEAFGFFPTHVSASIVSRARIIQRVSSCVVVIRPLAVVAHAPAVELEEARA